MRDRILARAPRTGHRTGPYGASGGLRPTTFHSADRGKTAGMSRRYRGNLAATIIMVAADVAAFILILWIVLWMLDANRANDLVEWIHDVASWLGGWAHDIFDTDSSWARTLLNYGLPAAVYLVVGHAVAGRVNRA